MTPPREIALLSVAFLGCALLGSPTLSSQKKQPPKEEQKKQLPKAWPKLDDKQEYRLQVLISALKRKKIRPQVKERNERDLIAMGAGVCRRLILNIHDRRDDVNEYFIRVLDALVKPAHADLLAKHANHKQVTGRRYVISRLVRMHNKKFVKVFEKARKDKDATVVYHAQLGLAREKMDLAAMDYLFKRVVDDWTDVGPEIVKGLEVLRGGESMLWLRKRVLNKDILDELAGIRLMRSLATKDHAKYIAGFLDSEDSVLKKEAINTLRVVVDGKKPIPLTKLTVFQIVNLSKEWKARVGS